MNAVVLRVTTLARAMICSTATRVRVPLDGLEHIAMVRKSFGLNIRQEMLLNQFDITMDCLCFQLKLTSV